MKVAFHSYKGGVGRTEIMVRMGTLLALDGYRVGLLDFDLEASGLVTIFRQDVSSLEQRELLNILRFNLFATAADALIDVTDFVERRYGRKPECPGSLRYLPTITNPNLSDGLKLQELQTQIDDLLRHIDEDLGIDLVLIDVKPGYSAALTVVTHCDLDRIVVVTRADKQNVKGLDRVWPQLVRYGLEPRLVANMVPHIEEAEQLLEQLAKVCHQKVDVRIDYEPKLAYQEIDSPVDENSSMHRGLLNLKRALLDH